MKSEFHDVIKQHAKLGTDLGFYHLFTEDDRFDGRHITVKGKKQLFFSSCSYLGLDTNAALIKASMEATERFGVNLSSSRVTVSLGLYEQLESMLAKVFSKPVYVTPSTTLGHIAAIPLLVGKNDAIIMDQQVHNSVKTAVQLLKPEGVHTEIIKHNRMDHLETRIQILKQNHDKVWYMADSVYSMFGDSAPFENIKNLLNTYEQFHFYVDDAHGMSWAGKNGRGYALSKMNYHERMIMATSLGKGYGSGGGALIFQNEDQKNLIKSCGSTSIFSGPLTPGVLGAAIASAKIHLSNEIDTLQDELFERMLYFAQTAKRYGLPVVGNELTPISFIATGKKEVAYKISSFLQKEGFYCMTTAFPAVPMKNSGLRLTVHNHLTLQDIDDMLSRIAEILPWALKDENSSMEEIYEAFQMSPKQETEFPLEQKKVA